MPRFTIQYHLQGTDFVPQEAIDADTMEDAARIAGLRVAHDSNSDPTLMLYTNDDMIALPKSSVSYCHIRAVLDRRRSAPVLFRSDADEEEGTTVQ